MAQSVSIEKIRSNKVALKGGRVEKEKEFKVKRDKARRGKTFTRWNME